MAGIGKIAKPDEGQWVPLTTTVAGLSLAAPISDTALRNALGISTVGRTGSYNDLLDKPVPVRADWGETNTAAASFILRKPNLGNYQTKASMAGTIAPDVPTNNTTYPSVLAVINYSMPTMGGQFSGIAKAFNNNDAATGQIRNMRFIKGDSAKLPNDVVNGEIIFLYETEASA